MRCYQIVYQENVEREIGESAKYISTVLNNPLAAIDLKNKLRKKIIGLSNSPYINHVIGNIYFVKIKKYKLYYKIDGDHIILFKFIHTLRQFDPEEYLNG